MLMYVAGRTVGVQVVEAPPRSQSEALDGHSLRVFLVEDSASIRERLMETISSLEQVEVVGYAQTEAGAIQALQGTTVDAVVLDLQLKEGHGLNVLRALRAPSDRPRVTVLVLTNFTSPQYRSRSMEMGADYFFDKAREYDRLCEVLAEIASRDTQDPG